jgi:hypothetical protein
MTCNPRCREGDMLRITKLDGDEFNPPGWAFAMRPNNLGSAYVDWVIRPQVRDLGSFVATSLLCDRYTIVPESDWPDEVFVALMKHTLIGGSR